MLRPLRSPVRGTSPSVSGTRAHSPPERKGTQGDSSRSPKGQAWVQTRTSVALPPTPAVRTGPSLSGEPVPPEPCPGPRGRSLLRRAGPLLSSLPASVGKKTARRGRRPGSGASGVDVSWRRSEAAAFLASGLLCLPGSGHGTGGGRRLRWQLPALPPLGRQTGWPWPEIICSEADPEPEAPGLCRFCCCLNSPRSHFASPPPLRFLKMCFIM